jgi:putative addiction module component (TIGR02574 family)
MVWNALGVYEMSTYAEILTAALSLPAQERTELADVLLASTDDDGSPFEISAEWREEIARRGTAYERGELKGRPWEQFEDEIRRKYEDHA